MEPPNSQPQISLPSPSRVRLVKSILRVLVISNVALGAYMFSKVKKKSGAEESKAPKPPAEESKAPKPPAEEFGKKTEDVSAAKEDVDSYSDPYKSIQEEFFRPPLTFEPTKVEGPLSQEQQRQLFEWLLEEKRKIKPKDHEEEKRIDEDKDILKRFIGADSLPRI